MQADGESARAMSVVNKAYLMKVSGKIGYIHSHRCHVPVGKCPNFGLEKIEACRGPGVYHRHSNQQMPTQSPA